MDTCRQEVGGSSIETSKIAGHASTAITEEYTLVGMKRLDELTRRIQEKRTKARREFVGPIGQSLRRPCTNLLLWLSVRPLA